MADDVNGPDDPDQGLELDVDGDSDADVLVPGLPGDHAIDMHPGRGNTEAFEVMVGYEQPPTSSPWSSMGQLEHTGYALRSQTARTGWRRTVIRVVAWASFVAAVAWLVGSLIATLVR